MTKNIFKTLVIAAASAAVIAGCEGLEPAPKNPANLTTPDRSEEYYASLRAYKQTEHSVAFGWFGNWTGSGANLENSLRGLPDSVDFVSLWGRKGGFTQAEMDDMNFVREKKGTRYTMCFIVDNIGVQMTPENVDRAEFWGFADGTEESMLKAVEKYANAICDSIYKYNLDGFDYDYEPNYGHSGEISGNPDMELKFIETLGKRLGPKSGSGKILAIDGEPQTINPLAGPYFDYFIVQAYSCYGDSDLDGRFESTVNNYVLEDGTVVLTQEEVAKKYIVTENFENYALTGGVDYTDRNGNTMKSLEGMARWSPVGSDGKKLRKGGVGTYHMEYEYVVSGYSANYPFLRKAIQIMNPAIK